jgi:hypothetical protein
VDFDAYLLIAECRRWLRDTEDLREYEPYLVKLYNELGERIAKDHEAVKVPIIITGV